MQVLYVKYFINVPRGKFELQDEVVWSVKQTNDDVKTQHSTWTTYPEHTYLMQ